MNGTFPPSENRLNILFYFFKDFIYLFMIDIERERKAETQAEGEAGSMPGAPGLQDSALGQGQAPNRRATQGSP